MKRTLKKLTIDFIWFCIALSTFIGMGLLATYAEDIF